ncbi:MAG: right-handed parallel beta-helix repeat-containing protein [Bacteroidia bacterium]|nr:right-handed parallel beta-helix repeat-containing protein [Bacteroidia bacterium]
MRILLTLLIILRAVVTFAQLPEKAPRPGDIVVIPPGKYSQKLEINYQGTPEKWITLIGKDVTLSGIEINGASYIKLSGFHLSGSHSNGLQIYNYAHHVIVDGIKVDSADHNGIKITGFAHDIVIKNAHVSTSGIDNITCHNSVFGPAGSKIAFINCRSVRSRGEQGFDITSGSEILLENCSSEHNGEGPINIGHGVKQVVVRNFIAEDEWNGPKVKFAEGVRFEGGSFNEKLRLVSQATNEGQGMGTTQITVVGNPFPEIKNKVEADIHLLEKAPATATWERELQDLAAGNFLGLPDIQYTIPLKNQFWDVMMGMYDYWVEWWR